MRFIFFIVLVSACLNTFSQTIYEIQGQASDSPHNGQSVTTKGIVTATYSGSYFIQDGDSAWTGLYIYDKTQKPALGDSIELSGTIDEYYNMTEMINISSYTLLSSGNKVPDPILIETADAQEKWESVFVKVVNAECTNTDLGYGEWEVNDGSGALVINDLGVAYAPVIGVKYAIIGPLDYSFNFYKIEPRSLDDIVQDLPLYFKTNPVASNISKSGFNLNWETNDNASAYVEYGLTTQYELGKQFSTVSSTLHTLDLENMEPAEIYYTKSYSINANNDTTPIHFGVFTTMSESSGKINVYFNHDQIAITLKNGFTHNIVDTIISYIKKAQTSIDIAIYDLNNHAAQSDSSNYNIIRAINKAFDSGVKIRVVTDAKVGNYALDSLNAAIPLIKRYSDGIMHHKFIIIDAQSTANSWLVTGSTNWTYNNLFMDFNNMICIQDQSLARAYLLEFNEMWGNNSDAADAPMHKFGKDKIDNTPHQFNINGVAVELYFSPSDKTNSKIVAAIENAQESIDFAMMAFTENTLGTAIVAAHNRGLTTNGYIDYVEYSGSEFNYLLENGVDVTDFQNPEGGSWPDAATLHHKFCVIDKYSEKPLLISGTHNWTASAESINDENTLFIYDELIAQQFYDEYEQLHNYMHGGSELVNTEVNNQILVYPNPSNGKFNVEAEGFEGGDIYIFDMLGKKVFTKNLSSKSFSISSLSNGIYLIIARKHNRIATQKIIIK